MLNVLTGKPEERILVARRNGIALLLLLFFILTANGFVPGGSATTIRHNTQNNTPHSNRTQHTKLQKQ
jgi:hypothetical protein